MNFNFPEYLDDSYHYSILLDWYSTNKYTMIVLFQKFFSYLMKFILETEDDGKS